MQEVGGSIPLAPTEDVKAKRKFMLAFSDKTMSLVFVLKERECVPSAPGMMTIRNRLLIRELIALE
jgi:hypothetical protein